MTSYYFFVDESGHVTQQAGISDATGPSRYLSMGGFLLSMSQLEAVDKKLDAIREQFKKKKNLHATELSHVQKIHFARELKEINPILFGVVSDKKTLRGFKSKSDGDPQDYYNRTALYLLSLLGRYMRSNKLSGSDVEIIFEHREHDYQRLRNYLKAVQRKPSGDEVDGIQEINSNLVRSEGKNDRHQFAVPDLLAHSIFSAFDRNRNNFAITECRYLAELFPYLSEEEKVTRFYLIQHKRMNDICEPTQRLLTKNGLIAM